MTAEDGQMDCLDTKEMRLTVNHLLHHKDGSDQRMLRKGAGRVYC